MLRRMNISFNESECQVINFTDITAQKNLIHEQAKSKMLSMLNTSVHHEMLGPLKTNVILTDHLCKELKKDPRLLEMAKTVNVSSRLVLLHANDLLDQRIIQNNAFEPFYERRSVEQSAMQIIQLLKSTLMDK